MSSIVVSGDTSGTVTLQAPAVAGSTTLTLPATSGTVVIGTTPSGTIVGTTDTQTLTNKTLTSPTITGASISSMASSVLTSGTVQNSTSVTFIDFAIPSWAKRITVMFNGVSTNGTSPVQAQLGTSGGIQASGYNGSIQYTSVVSANLTSGFKTEDAGVAAYIRNGVITLSLIGANTWSGLIVNGLSNQIAVFSGAGSVSLAGTLTQVRVTTVNGTDTFDAGSINIMYE